MSARDEARELFDHINAARAGIAAPLEWSAEIAAAAETHAQRCANRRQLTTDDLEDGSTVADRLGRVLAAAAVAEILASGPVAWLTPTHCHERFMAVPTERASLLDPNLTHAGIARVESDDVAYYVADFARIDSTAPQIPAPPTRAPVSIVPLWEPEPVRWRLMLDPAGDELRAQIAARFSLDGRRLHGIDMRNVPEPILDRKPSAAETSPIVALSLAEFHPPFVTLRGALRRNTNATAAMPVTDTVVTGSLPLLTPLEQEAVDLVQAFGAAATADSIAIAPEILMPRRRAGSPAETIWVQLAVDLRPENERESETAISALQDFARHHELLGSDSRFGYDLRQELTFGVERDALIQRYQHEILRRAIHELSSGAGSRPLLFVVPYATNDGFTRFVAQSARRVSLMKAEAPEITRAFGEAREAASRLLERPRGDAEALALSSFSTLSVISSAEWQQELGYWIGVDNAAKGIFANATVLQSVCEGDARELVHRVVTPSEHDDEHPLQKLALLTSQTLLRRLAKSLPPRSTWDSLRRRTEPSVLVEIGRLVDDPTTIVESVPEAAALLQEATWICQSRLRTELEALYRRYRSGEQGRNMEAFVRTLKLVRHHLGGAVDDVNAAEHVPISHQRLDDQAATATARYRAEVEPVQRRYLRGLIKRFARALLPWTRSRLPGDLRPPIVALAENLVSVYWNRRLRVTAATRAFDMPIVLAQRIESFAEAFLRDLDHEVQTHRKRLERFLTDPTAVIVGGEPGENLDDTAVRAANIWWSDWIADAREQQWMKIGAGVLGEAYGREESPFAFSAARITERLLIAIGAERAGITNESFSGADVDVAVSLMRERSKFGDVVDPNRLLETVVKHYPLQVTTLTQRSVWIVIAGRPLTDQPKLIKRLRDAIHQKKGTDYDTLVWAESTSVSGIHLVAECHGFPLSALVL